MTSKYEIEKECSGDVFKNVIVFVGSQSHWQLFFKNLISTSDVAEYSDHGPPFGLAHQPTSLLDLLPQSITLPTTVPASLYIALLGRTRRLITSGDPIAMTKVG